MNKQQMANKLTEDIKSKRTASSVERAFRYLYQEASGDFSYINEVMDLMSPELEGYDIFNEQYDNKAQLTAMAKMRQIRNQAKAAQNINDFRK